MDKIKEIWEEAQKKGEHLNLQESLISELSDYLGIKNSVAKQRCMSAAQLMERKWLAKAPRDKESILSFYSDCNYYLYELTWWHCLIEDRRFLDSVICMEFSKSKGLRSFLDFGCGIGSHSILMSKNQFDVTLFDVSKKLMEYSKWRMQTRGLSGRYCIGDDYWELDEKFQFILAMDVLEHISEPNQTLIRLSNMLDEKGILCASVPPIPYPNRSMHQNFYRRDLRKIAETLGLQQIGRLSCVDIFIKKTSSISKSKFYYPKDKINKANVVDKIFLYFIHPIYIKLPEKIKNIINSVNIAYTKVIQLFQLKILIKSVEKRYEKN